MIWNFIRVERIEENWGKWSALVVLEKGGVEEAFYLNFDTQPTTEAAEAAGVTLANTKNTEEAVQVSRVVSRQEFVGRLTFEEFAAVIAAGEQSPTLKAYLRRLDMYDLINLDSDQTVAGLNLLESIGLIGPGRAAQIRGV